MRITVKENLEEKHLFSYNNVGQRAQMEIYKVDGLAEKTTFTYNSASSTAKPIREIHEVFGDGSYREEFEYQKNEKNQLQKIRRRYFENGQLKSDLTTTYSNYIENTHTKEVTEGYDCTITGSDGIISGSTPFKRTITLTLNKSKDIVMYKSEINRPDKDNDSFSQVFNFEYVYNTRNDWVQLIFSPDKMNKYIIIREIQYTAE